MTIQPDVVKQSGSLVRGGGRRKEGVSVFIRAEARQRLPRPCAPRLADCRQLCPPQLTRVRRFRFFAG